jgi:hypothetical protein
MAAAKKKEKKPIYTIASSGHITNLKQSILETFDIYEVNLELSLVQLLGITRSEFVEQKPKLSCSSRYKLVHNNNIHIEI